MAPCKWGFSSARNLPGRSRWLGGRNASWSDWWAGRCAPREAGRWLKCTKSISNARGNDTFRQISALPGCVGFKSHRILARANRFFSWQTHVGYAPCGSIAILLLAWNTRKETCVFPNGCVSGIASFSVSRTGLNATRTNGSRKSHRVGLHLTELFCR